MAVGPLIIKTLDAANIEPALIKAIIKKPPMVHGGPRARRFPWPRRRHFDKRERDAVMRLMNREISRGGAIVYGGPEEKAYCQAFADYLGGGFAKAVNSGTNAVYVALRALDVQDCRLQDVAERECLFGIALGASALALNRFIEVSTEDPAQPGQIRAARGENALAVGVVREGEQQVLEREVRMTTRHRLAVRDVEHDFKRG